MVDGKTLTFVSEHRPSEPNQISTGGHGCQPACSRSTRPSGNTGTASSVSGGVITLHTGTVNGTLSISSSNSSALTALGLSGGVTLAATGASPSLSGETLLIAATGGGTATSITFGLGTGQVSSLNQLNAALAANNLQATHRYDRQASPSPPRNDAASSTIGAITGTATATGQAFNGWWRLAPVADPNAQATRAGLVAQYNNMLDADQYHRAGCVLQRRQPAERRYAEAGLQRNRQIHPEHHRASPSIRRALACRRLPPGIDFLDNNSANKALTSLWPLHTTLRSEASTLGSNLSIVQIRQDFNKNLINVLQTGCLEPDAGRHQRGSGQQPGAVDPPVDRGLRAGARQPVAAERASAAPLIPALQKRMAGLSARPFSLSTIAFSSEVETVRVKKRIKTTIASVLIQSESKL